MKKILLVILMIILLTACDMDMYSIDNQPSGKQSPNKDLEFICEVVNSKGYIPVWRCENSEVICYAISSGPDMNCSFKNKNNISTYSLEY